MRSKVLFLCVLILGSTIIPNPALAEPAIIKDIVVDTEDASVKISITASQTLQIETFKNDESPANYIVLDFLGTVYTNLPSMINVNKGPVEKVSLVRGDDKKVKIIGEDYYSLDFLAINLNEAADYHINQSKSVIDLSIGIAGLKAGESRESKAKDYTSSQTAVELTPPIVVSKQKHPEKEITREKDDYKAYSSSERLGETQTRRYASSKSDTSKKVRRRRRKKSISKTKSTKGSSRRRRRRKQKVEMPKPEKKAISKQASQARERIRTYKAPVRTYKAPERSAKTNELIDQIVNETIREKERTISKIQDLTYELKRMQEELYLSKGEKSKLESKINEILAKLDELQAALDEEIRRRRMLGEAVEDLVAKRDEYLKAKQLFEELQMKLSQITDDVETIKIEAQTLQAKVNEARVEKNNLSSEVDGMEKKYNKLKSNFDRAIDAKQSISIQIDKISREIEKLRIQLNEKIDEKEQMAIEVKELEGKNKYTEAELYRLRQLLKNKEVFLHELEARYQRLKAELDTAVSEKLKIDYSYSNAKTEFERIKKEITQYLEKTKRE